MNKILLVITGEYLSIDNIIDVSRNNMKVKLSQDVQAKVNEGYLQLKTAIQKADSIYGISTGVGALKDIPIFPENKEEYQKNLLLSHAVGTGKRIKIGCFDVGTGACHREQTMNICSDLLTGHPLCHP